MEFVPAEPAPIEAAPHSYTLKELGALPLASSVEVVERKPVEQRLVDESLAPYHLHFSKEIEGAALNPESAEFNFDTTLLLTNMIRGRQTSRTNDESTQEAVDWYFDKHGKKGFGYKDLNSPRKVVSLWLEKLGPHNDLTGADHDFMEARAWLVDEKLRDGVKDRREIDDTLIELDIELAEMLDSESRQQLRDEAIALFDDKIRDLEDKERFQEAAIAKMRQTALKIEDTRERVLGTNQLTHAITPEQYDVLEENAEGLVYELAKYTNNAMVAVDKKTADYLDAADENDPNCQKSATRYARDTGMFFEAFTYINLMQDVIESDSLAAVRVRPGTFREESSTAHKVDSHPNSRIIKDENGDTIVLTDNHGFSFNFDLVVTQLKGETPILDTTYIQNKMNPNAGPAENASEASKSFFGNKKFRYFLPSDILRYRLQESKRAALRFVSDSMKTSLQNTYEL